MTKSKHLVKIISVLFVLLGIFIACSKKSTVEETPIRIGLIPWAGYAHIYVAQQEGFFSDRGVETEIVLFESNTDMGMAFRYGELDALFTLVPDVVMLYAEGWSPVVISIIDYSENGDVVVATPDLDGVSDLKGRDIAFEGVNTFSHLFILELLRSAGLSELDVTLHDIRADMVPEAIAAGTIDAGHVWEPFLSQALDEGNHIIATASDIPAFIVDVFVCSREVLHERREDFVGVVAALDAALSFSEGDRREDAHRIMAESMGMSLSELEEGLSAIHRPSGEEGLLAMTENQRDGSMATAIRIVSDIYSSRGQLTEIPQITDLVDPSILSEVLGR